MDLTIPGGMGGKEASKLLLEMDPSANMIVSSGYSDDPVMAEYEKYGFKAVLLKPYGLGEVARLMDQWGRAGAAQGSVSPTTMGRVDPTME
jgi:DNA-binding NarL/FixJ family response regulator